MGSPQRRRDTRYRAKIPLTLRDGSREQSILTEDVSFRGFFARTDTPPPLRQLIRIEGELPPAGTPFSSHGMPIYVMEPGNDHDRDPGVGIQFYAMGSERAKWDAFINHVKENTGLEAVNLVEPLRRRHPRYEIIMPVKPRDFEELLTFYSRDASQGGMFLTTDRQIDVGTPLRLDLEHPETGEIFSIGAEVRRTSPDGSGIGVEFVDVSAERREALYEFIHASVPELDADDLIEEDDPNLE